MARCFISGLPRILPLAIAIIVCDPLPVSAGAGLQDMPALHPSAAREPADGSRSVAVRPLFRWQRGGDSARYVLQYGLDPSFASVTGGDSSIADTAYVPRYLLLNDSTYYWRVGIKDTSGVPRFGPAFSFTVVSPPRLSNSRLAFGVTPVGDTTWTTVVFTNPIPGPLVVDSAWSASGRFFLAHPLPLTVDSLDSIILLVAFTPQRFLLLSDTLWIRTTAGDPAIAVSGNSPPPIAQVSRSDIAFRHIALGHADSTRLTIFNRGAINRLSVSRLGVSSSVFRVGRRVPFSVAPLDSAIVTLHFIPGLARPRVFGTFEDTLRIETTGGEFRLPVSGESPPPRIGTATGLLNFGEIALSDSATVAVRLANLSVNLLQIDSLRLLTSSFRVATRRLTMKAGDTVSVPVRFLPARYGVFVDTLLVFGNIPSRPYRIPIRGAVPPPVVIVDRELLEFGEVPGGESVRLVLGISNSSVTPLSIDSITTSRGEFRVEKFPVYTGLRRGDTLRVTITFSPDSTAFYRDTLVIANNSLTPQFRIPLVGSGRDAPSNGTHLPGSFTLYQNYPNPFRGVTTFRYALPERCAVRLVIYNSLGQEIGVAVDAEQEAGTHNVPWRVETASGMYLYKLTATPTLAQDRQHVASKRMVILR